MSVDLEWHVPPEVSSAMARVIVGFRRQFGDREVFGMMIQVDGEPYRVEIKRLESNLIPREAFAQDMSTDSQAGRVG